MKRVATSAIILCLLGAGLVARGPRAPLLESSTSDDQWRMSPSAPPRENAAALEKEFASPSPRVLHFPAGTWLLPCGSTFSARGALSLMGAGADRTIIRLQRGCTIEHPLFSWASKSNVRLSDFTLDLNNSRTNMRQNILEFLAYDGDAGRLQIDHIAISNGNTLSFQIAVGAAGGFRYRRGYRSQLSANELAAPRRTSASR